MADYDYQIPIVGRTYRHFKGGRYVVCSIAQHSETLETLVVYRSLADPEIWARPLTSWQASATLVDGQTVPRFTLEE